MRSSPASSRKASKKASGACRRTRGSPAKGADRRKVNIVAQECGIARNGGIKVGMLDRLDQAQMTFGQGKIATSWKHAKHRKAGALHSQAGQPLVPERGDTVQDDPRKRQVGHVFAKP